MFFEAGKLIAVGSGDVLDEAVDKTTLCTDLHADAHGIINGDEGKTQCNGKNGGAQSFAVGDCQHERCDKGTVCTGEVSRLKKVCPIDAVLNTETCKLHRLRDKNNHDGDDECVELCEKILHDIIIANLSFFQKACYTGSSNSLKTISMVTIILIAALVAIAFFFVVIYNSLVTMRVRVDEAWSDIDVQLKRRYDLIPNLVETVKGYAKHESQTLEAVIDARSKATQVTVDAAHATQADMQQLSEAQNSLTGALWRLFALAENYPDLKANQNFLQLQGDLTDTEDKIQAARRFYNGTVRDYNTKVETVPSNIVAMLFGFVKRAFFEIVESERENVKVQF